MLTIRCISERVPNTIAAMAPEDDKLKAIEAALSGFESAREFIESGRDLAKMRIAMWDKLTVLNAGTLALSFTAASAFQSHRVGDGGTGFLFAAWKALVASIALALFAQHFATNSITRLTVRSASAIGRAKLDMQRLHAESLGANLTEKSPEYMKLAKFAETPTSSREETLAAVCGLIAKCLTVVAYCWLYKFAKLNLAR